MQYARGDAQRFRTLLAASAQEWREYCDASQDNCNRQAYSCFVPLCSNSGVTYGRCCSTLGLFCQRDCSAITRAAFLDRRWPIGTSSSSAHLRGKSESLHRCRSKEKRPVLPLHALDLAAYTTGGKRRVEGKERIESLCRFRHGNRCDGRSCIGCIGRE